MVLRALVEAARVAEVRVDDRLLRPRVVERFEPVGGPRAPAARVDDEVGVQQRVALVGGHDAPPLEHHAADAIAGTRGQQARDVVAFEDRHVPERRDAVAHRPVEQRAAEGQHLDVRPESNAPPGRREPCDVLRALHDGRACGLQFGADAWEESLEDLQPSREQDVQVRRLDDAGARRRGVGIAVPLDDRDAVEVVREDSGREQPRDAAADDHGHGFLGALHISTIANGGRQGL